MELDVELNGEKSKKIKQTEINKLDEGKTTIINAVNKCANVCNQEEIGKTAISDALLDLNATIMSVMGDTLQSKGRLDNVFVIGNDLIRKNFFQNYSAIFIEIKNKSYFQKMYGTETCHGIGHVLFKYLTNFIDSDDVIGNHYPGAYIGFVKKDTVRQIIDAFGKIRIDSKSGTKEEMYTKIAYYDIAEDDSVESALDNVFLGMEKIIGNKDVDILKVDEDFNKLNATEEHVLNSFDKAIAKKEFITYYQPKVDSSEEKLCGAEALVRLKYNGKMIPPGAFIPVLENSNKMMQLDYYMLRSVCEDIKKWLDEGIEPVRVSINFSRKNFKNPFFAQNVLNIINEYNIDKRYLEIEITETVKDNELAPIHDFIVKMHENGIEVSMDDFGSGYSSLSALTNLDFDTIKIDKTLVDSMNNRKNYIILSMLSKICEEFGIKVIVEGVETENQVKMLDSLGYHYIQGYYYDKPLAKEEFEDRLKNKSYVKCKQLMIKR